MIEARDIHVSYDEPVLRGVDFDVQAGQVAALVGRNGAGKTTLLKVLSGRLRPDSGAARIDGVDIVSDRERAQKKLAFLPQDVRFHPALTPRQVLSFYAGLREESGVEVGDRLADVDLEDAADRRCDELSGGMRQRLGLAVVQLSHVPVLLLDEPGLSLDSEWRNYLADVLRRLARDGTAILMATHHPEIWEDVIDRQLTCEQGRIDVAGSESSSGRPGATSGSTNLKTNAVRAAS